MSGSLGSHFKQFLVSPDIQQVVGRGGGFDGSTLSAVPVSSEDSFVSPLCPKNTNENTPLFHGSTKCVVFTVEVLKTKLKYVCNVNFSHHLHSMLTPFSYNCSL